MNKASQILLFSALVLYGSESIFSDSSLSGCQDDFLVVNQYPGAQIWYQKMIKKYPQASLEKVKFGISDNYESGFGIIYFPEFRLQQMHEIFHNCASITPEMMKQFAEDEWLLLHEAAHVLNNDVQGGSIATLISIKVILAMAVGSLNHYERGKIDISSGIIITTLSAVVAYASLILYARFQEYRADDFANQQADAQALHAGKNWFARLNTLMSFENISIPDCFNNFSQFLQDPVHPTPKHRASKILQALMLRFGQIS